MGKRTLATLILAAMLSPFAAEAAVTPAQRAAFRFSTARIDRPAPFSPVLDHIAARPESTALTHQLFADENGFYETVERMPQMTQRIAFEYYLNTEVRSDEIVFTYGSDTPVAKFTLPQGKARAVWEAEDDVGDRRALMMEAASSLLDGMIADLGDRMITVEEGGRKVTRSITREDIGFRIGSADTISEAIENVLPYAQYFMQRSEAAGLDPLIWANTIQETNFSIDLISNKGYEGPFQLGHDEALRQGLIAEKPLKKVMRKPYKVKGKTKYRRAVSYREPSRPHINEVFHPLLPMEASAPTVREYALLTGSLTSGLSAYHAGPGNIWKMRAMDLPAESPRSDLAQAIAQEYGFDAEIIIAPDDRFAAPLSLEQQSSMIRVGWRLRNNGTGYKIESSKYVPRTMSIMQLLRERLERPGGAVFEADQVSVDYKAKLRIKAKELRPFFRSNEEFRHYNSHFRNFMLYPEKGVEFGDIAIPEGTRILLPLGQSERFFSHFEDRVRSTPVITYWNGVVSPSRQREATAADAAYTSIALLRHAGQYSRVDRRMLEAVHELVSESAKATPSPALEALHKTVDMDIEFLDSGIYAPFLGTRVAGR